MSFPLYDTLLQKSNSNSIDTLDKNKIITYINQMDQDGNNKIYALIKYHSLFYDSDNTIQLNYKENTFKFDFDTLPEQLQKIIWEFIKIHIKYMKQCSNN